jgi:hypothetical protein
VHTHREGLRGILQLMPAVRIVEGGPLIADEDGLTKQHTVIAQIRSAL